MYIYIYRYIYIYLPLKDFLEVAIESYPEWDLNHGQWIPLRRALTH